MSRLVTAPDLHDVAKLMRRVWDPPCWSYSPEFLAAWIEKPGGLPELSVGLAAAEGLVAYEAMVPYEIQVHGERYSVLQTGFWTADAARGGPAAGWRVYRELVERARETGATGFLTTLEKGADSEPVFELASRQMRLDLRVLGEFPQLFAMPRSLRRKLESDAGSLRSGAHVLPYDASFETDALALLDESAARVELARVTLPEEADYVLRTRPLTASWILKEGGAIRALATGFIARVRRQQGEAKTVLLELSAADPLDEGTRRHFLARVLEDDFWSDVSMITVTSPDPFGSSLLRGLGFLPTKQMLRLYFVPFERAPELERVSSFRLDIL